MRYFHRIHSTPDSVLKSAGEFFAAKGLERLSGGGDMATFRDSRGEVSVSVEIEGGHYARVTVATSEVGESEVDRLAKRFLAELHASHDRAHAVRGAY